MAEVLCVYREVQVVKKAAAKAEKSKKPVAVVSTTRSLKSGHRHDDTDLPPVPGRHASFARDNQYKRHGTLSLWPGSICSPARSTRSSGSATAAASSSIPQASRCRLSAQHRDQADPRQTLPTHFKENPSLARHPAARPLRLYLHAQARLLAQLIKGFFLRFARSVLRHNRGRQSPNSSNTSSPGIDDVNRHPVIHTWSYSLPRPPDIIRTTETLT